MADADISFHIFRKYSSLKSYKIEAVKLYIRVHNGTILAPACRF